MKLGNLGALLCAMIVGVLASPALAEGTLTYKGTRTLPTGSTGQGPVEVTPGTPTSPGTPLPVAGTATMITVAPTVTASAAYASGNVVGGASDLH